jgi:hypothetical protein
MTAKALTAKGSSKDSNRVRTAVRAQNAISPRHRERSRTGHLLPSPSRSPNQIRWRSTAKSGSAGGLGSTRLHISLPWLSKTRRTLPSIRYETGIDRCPAHSQTNRATAKHAADAPPHIAARGKRRVSAGAGGAVAVVAWTADAAPFFQRSSSATVTNTRLRPAPGSRRTGNPRSLSHFCAVRVLTSR